MTTKVLDATEFLAIHPDIQQALADTRPVLALESTVITHGMSWPDNLETALKVEAAVRKEGAVPATIAVLDGALKLGLDEKELERLAKLGTRAVKCSRRDLPFLLQSGEAGATTVAATMVIAALAGLRVFATGGIGGVHRGAERHMDISADLQELARTPVAVVCSGAKSILDIGMTLEYLETHGVPVIGFQTDRLPAFYAADSGFPVDHRLESTGEIAAVLQKHWALGNPGGAVIANPVPQAHALDREVAETAVDKALAEAERQGITGKVLTPFLLARIERLTGGESLKANRALLIANARLGARIAAALQGRQVTKPRRKRME